MKHISKTIKLSDSREITIETGKLAKQADGAVVVRMGDAMLLATVVAKKENTKGIDFLPLSVDYQEKFASAGKIPGGFLKREGRLGDHEVLISRLVDRAIRPLFPDNYTAETQIMITLISADVDVMPETLAALAASAALVISPIPFEKAISEVRVAKIDGQLCINPTPKNLERADIDLIVAATEDSILMVEGEMNEVQEEEMIEAIRFAHEEIKKHCQFQNEFAKEVGVIKLSYQDSDAQEVSELPDALSKEIYEKVCEVVRKGINSKKDRKAEFKKVKEAYAKVFSENPELSENTELFERSFYEIEKKAVRDIILNERVRLDGRKVDEIRNIWSEINYLPSAHGSSLFTRGETQCLSTVTLGSKLDEQLIDRATINGYSKFMLHYNFPGFSTGEVKPNRGPGRREIGHGNLAMRALKQVMPSEDENPYTVRIVADILESNGSSSMATVCSGSMALMDAGVAIKSPVSGIAMGLVLDPITGNYATLSDILGDEDALGDMDFKVAGTAKGITACQMDIKVSGISFEILKSALAQSKNGRLHILAEMNKVISESRKEHKPNAPRITVIKVKKEVIGAIIGPGGKIIQEMQRKSGATVVIEEENGMGIVRIFAPNAEAVSKAEQMIKAIIAEPEVGAVYNGKVKSIREFGAFVEFMPGKEGLLHISEVKWERIENLEDVLEENEEIQVKLLEIDPKTGKFKLSRKALLPKPDAV